MLENVAFALDLQAGQAVHRVITELESLGYSWAYRILDTRSFGLPQRRRRLFVLAALDADPAAILMDGIDTIPQGIPSDPTMIGFYWTEGTSGVGWSPDAVPPLKGGSGVGIPSPPAVWERQTGRFITPGIEDAERLQGFTAGWTRPAASLTRGERRRWMLVGNAVSVPVAEWLGQRMAQPTGGGRQLDPIGTITGRPKTPRAAAGGVGQKIRLYNSYNEGPSIPLSLTLSDFKIQNSAPLSNRALSGFARRYRTGSLKQNREFLDALTVAEGHTT
ncbi:hypothetical protein ABIC70_005542 [Methylobacterium sp. 1973]